MRAILVPNFIIHSLRALLLVSDAIIYRDGLHVGDNVLR